MDSKRQRDSAALASGRAPPRAAAARQPAWKSAAGASRDMRAILRSLRAIRVLHQAGLQPVQWERLAQRVGSARGSDQAALRRLLQRLERHGWLKRQHLGSGGGVVYSLSEPGERALDAARQALQALVGAELAGGS